MNADAIELLRAAAKGEPSRDALMVALAQMQQQISDLQARVEQQDCDLQDKEQLLGEKERTIETLQEQVRFLTQGKFRHRRSERRRAP